MTSFVSFGLFLLLAAGVPRLAAADGAARGRLARVLAEPVAAKCPWALETANDKAHYRARRLTHRDLHEAHTKNLRVMRWLSEQLALDVMVNWGTLLGQYFNGETLPWDEDDDVVLFCGEARFRDWMRGALPRSNYSTHEHDGRMIEYYELGPEHVIYYDYNPRHHIEFRLIHVATGVYVDIMLLKKVPRASAGRVRQSRPKRLAAEVYTMKANENGLWGGHVFNPRDLHPLAPCLLNGVALLCPANKTAVLTQEYGAEVLRAGRDKGRFDGRCFVPSAAYARYVAGDISARELARAVGGAR